MGAGTLRAGHLRGIGLGVVGLIAAIALTLAPARANAATPVLEFAPSSGSSFPITFAADGGAVSARLADFDSFVNCVDSAGAGAVTGPRTAVGNFTFTGCKAVNGPEAGQKCKSPGAGNEEIRAESVDAELVYLNQSNHKVALLLNPGEGIYMTFTCGGELVEAGGPFLSPVGEVNKVATSFSAILSADGATQEPHEYETASGEKRQAIPMGRRAGNMQWDETGVSLNFTIQTSAPLQIKSVNAAEVEAIEAKQRAEEEAAAKKRQEEEAAAKKRQEDEAAAKKRADEEAAAKKAQEQALALRLAEKRAKANAAQQRAKGLKRCRGLGTKQKRVRCETRVKKKFSATKANNGNKGGLKS